MMKSRETPAQVWHVFPILIPDFGDYPPQDTSTRFRSADRRSSVEEKWKRQVGERVAIAAPGNNKMQQMWSSCDNACRLERKIGRTEDWPGEVGPDQEGY